MGGAQGSGEEEPGVGAEPDDLHVNMEMTKSPAYGSLRRRGLVVSITGYNSFMVHAPGSLRARIKDSTEQAWRLYCALELVIPHRESSKGEQVRTSRQRLVASTIPWHATAAGLTMELHAEVRRLENHLKEELTGQLGSRRGGSTGNTQFALRSLANLTETVDDQTALSVLNVLDRWNRRADAVLHPENGLHRVPRQPGEKEWRCPHCTFQTMRWNPGSGVIVCVNPACHNTDGVRPRWFAEFAVEGDQLRFSWRTIGEAA